MNETKTAFGEVLRRLRRRAALSQEELASRSGVSRNGISDLERGLHPAPHLVTVRLLADALNLSDTDRDAVRPMPPAQPAADPSASPRPSPGAPPLSALPLTRLIGRETEVMTLRTMLRDDEVRWLTLTGPGGVGKTRLAVAVADALHETYADGIVFVDLSPLTDADLVVPTVAAAIGVREATGQPMVDTVATVLAPKRLLLVLDNCERVLRSAPDLSRLLASSAGLTIFATSREPFHVRGEHRIPLPPLPLPWTVSAAAHQPPIEVALNPAVMLFVERARVAQLGFVLQAENVATIAAICQRLDGLPLAIELAAAWVNVLSPAALLTRLEHRLPLLTHGGRDLPSRQRTMRDAIAWSYDLLTDEEQALYRQLAVFVGGFTLDAAEQVVGASGATSADAPTFPSSTLDLVAALVDKSLLQSRVAQGAEPRFTMLETVREFAWERLAASGEEQAVRERHAAYVLALAEAAGAKLEGSEQGAWLDRLGTEHDNLRAALSWALVYGPGSAIRLGAALWRFWWIRGHLSEGLGWLEQVLALGEGAPPVARIRALNGAAVLARERGDLALAEARAIEALAGARASEDPLQAALALNTLGSVAADRGDDQCAEQRFGEALALCRAAGDRRGIAAALGSLGHVVWDRGELDQATTYFAEGAALCREIGDASELASKLSNLGLIAATLGDPDRAAPVVEEALGLARALGDSLGVIHALHTLSKIALEQGDLDRAVALGEDAVAQARELGNVRATSFALRAAGIAARHRHELARATGYLSEALAIFRAIGPPWAVTCTLADLAAVARLEGDLDYATVLLHEAAGPGLEAGDPMAIVEVLHEVALLLTASEQWDGATRLFGAEAALQERLGAPQPRSRRAAYERATVAARAVLGEGVFAGAWANGHGMPLEALVAAARAELDAA